MWYENIIIKGLILILGMALMFFVFFFTLKFIRWLVSSFYLVFRKTFSFILCDMFKLHNLQATDDYQTECRYCDHTISYPRDH